MPLKWLKWLLGAFVAFLGVVVPALLLAFLAWAFVRFSAYGLVFGVLRRFMLCMGIYTFLS